MNSEKINYNFVFILILFVLLFVLFSSIISCGNNNRSNQIVNTINTNRQYDQENEDEYHDNETTKHPSSLIRKPKHIDGTMINKRPTEYLNGKSGGILIMGDYSGDPKTFNIILATEEASINTIRRFQINLMEYNEDFGKWSVFPGDHAKGSSGKGYDVNITKDGKQTMTVYLRNDILWTDGKLMKADDWVWYWNNIYTDKYISPGGYERTSFLMDNGELEQIKAEQIGDFEFKFIFPRVVGEPEMWVDFSPMPKHILKPIYDEGTQEDLFTLWSIDTPVSELVGNGPWRLVMYDQNNTLVFEANRSFFMKDDNGTYLPYADKLIINTFLDQNTLHLTFVGGQLDTYYIQNANFSEIIENSEQGNYTVLNGGVTPESEFIIFNQNSKSKRMEKTPQLEWFSQKEFRQAMSLLIDRKIITKQIHQGLAEPDFTYLPEASPYFDSDVTFDNSYNPDKALDLLESIGIRDRNGDGILEDKNENKIKFEINTNCGNIERERTVNTIVSGWKAYGVHANPSFIEFNVLITRLTTSYNWESVLISLNGSLFPFNDNLYLSSGNIHVWNPKKPLPETNWESEVDTLYNTAKYESDFDLRKELINEMFSILYDEAPMIPLVKKNIFRVVRNDWGNINWDRWSELGGYNNLRIYKK